MQRIVLALVALALVGAVAFALLGRDAGSAPVEAPRGEGAPRAPAASPAGADVALPGADASARTSAPIDATSDATVPPAATAAGPAAPEAPAPDDLTIAVVDAAGAAVADVPVGVRRDDAVSRLQWSAPTGSDGRARWPHGRSQLRERGGAGVQFAAVFAFPLADGPEQLLLPDAPDPVRLVLPPTGAVDVVVDDAAGIADADLTVELRSPQESTRAAQFVVPARAQPVHSTARFARVGLGTQWRAIVHRAGQSLVASVDFAGPRLPGQTIVAHAALGTAVGPPVLLVHVRDERDSPLRTHQVRVAMSVHRPGSTTSSTFSLPTDSEGVLRLALAGDSGEPAQRQLALSATTAAEVAARIDVPDRLLAGENDLGIARMQPQPVLCSGVVLGPAGPVADASVSLVVEQRSGSSTWWEPPSHQQPVTSAADGRFALRGDTAAERIGVQVEATGFLSYGPTACERGADLQITLAAAATVTGTVLIGDVVQLHDVVVDLQSGDHSESVHPEADGARGAFTFTGLRAGTATVRLRVRGEAEGLRVDGVALRAGETTQDSRLQDVDLARGRRAVRFTVVDAQSGAPVAEARVVVLPTDPTATSFEGYVLDRGEGRIVTARPVLGVLVFAEGYRNARIDAVADGQVVALRRALAVRLRLPAGCAAPTAPVLLEVSMQPAGPVAGDNVRYELRHGMSGIESGSGGAPWIGSDTARCTDGSAVLRVREPGDYVVTWRLRRGEQQTAVGASTHLLVTDDAGEQQATAQFTAKDLADAVATLAR